MVVATEVLGALPSTAAEWLFLLVTMIGAILSLTFAAEKLVELLGGNAEGLHRYGNGLALPVAWIGWSALLLLSRHDVAAVLVVLLGTLGMSIALRTIVRRCDG